MDTKYIIKSYYAETEEDDYRTGMSGKLGSSWSNVQLPVAGEYDSPRSALAALSDVNGYDFCEDWWENDPSDEDDWARWDTDFLVNRFNCEANDDELEQWRIGRLRLWNCHISVRLGKIVIANFTREDTRL